MSSAPRADQAKPNGARQLRLSVLHQILGDRYNIEAQLGRGAFATVYLARNRHLERFEAVKVLSETCDDKVLTRRFIDEAKVVASLDHPNIVKVYDYGETEGILWCSMQYVNGPTLRAELDSCRQLASATALDLLLPLIDGLEHSHRHGVVHRDVKPSNILLSSEGHPYLMDFGIAKSTLGGRQTATSSILGTPYYIAPEQVEGDPVDGRADLYAVAATLYELLSGQPPFRGETAVQTMLLRLRSDPKPLSHLLPGVDPRLEAIVMRGLARHRNDRFASAAEMHRELVQLRDPTTGGAYVPRARVPRHQRSGKKPSGTTTVEARGTRRGDSHRATLKMGTAAATRWPWWSAATVAVLVVIGGWLTWHQIRSTDRSTRQPEALGQVGIPANPPLAEPATLRSQGNEETTSPKEPAEDEPRARLTGIAREPAEPPTTANSNGPTQDATAEPPTSAVAASPPPKPEVEPAIPPRAVVPPKLSQAVEPQVEATDVELCAGQEVILTVRVGLDGGVERARVLQAVHPTCAAAARKAAEAYRFQPATDIAGQPVAGSTTIFIGFGE